MNYKDIIKHRNDITSQYGEDGILAYLTELMADDLTKTCCEVGAGDGTTYSNVYQLWKNFGWNALLIEGAKDRYTGLMQQCEAFQNAHPVNTFITAQGKRSIWTISKEHNVNLRNGIIVIDIDSFDYYVFANVADIKASICIVEFNNSIPPWIDYNDPEGDVFLRQSLKALERIGKTIGYRLVATTITNGVFIREDLCEKYNIDEVESETAYLYKEQCENRSIWGVTIASQLITSYPVFLNRPSFIIRAFFHLRGLVRSLIGREPYRRPSVEVKDCIKKSGLYVQIIHI